MRVLRRRWHTVALLAGLALAATAAGLLLTGAPYQATATLQAPVPAGASSNDLEYADRNLNTFKQLAEGDMLRDRVEQSVLGADARNVRVTLEAIPDTELLRLTARADSPTLARRAADAWAAALVDEVRAAAGRAAREARGPILARLDNLERRLSDLRAELGATRDPRARASLDQRLRSGELQYEALAGEAATVDAREPAGALLLVDSGRASGSVTMRVGSMLLLGLAAGLIAGVGLALLVERRTPRLGTLDEVEEAAGAPVLATIPPLDEGEAGALARGGSRTEEAFAALRARLLADGWRAVRPGAPAAGVPDEVNATGDATRSGEPDEVAALLGEFPRESAVATVQHRPGSAPTDARAQPARTLLVASASDGDGKTFVAANLAAALARSRYRTVLVDADLRSPTLHRRLGVGELAGLSELLERDEHHADPLGSLADTEIPQLTLLTGGQVSPRSSDLLASARMKAVVAQLGVGNDFVVIDSPALTTASDAAELASCVGEVILVVGRTPARGEAIEGARRELEAVHARVLGLVVNRWSREPLNERAAP
jgi:capsular exopolysaccharide synthesis family protein